MNPWPDLRSILHGLDWVIVGGIATRAYMPERMTQDMDILVHQKNGATAVAELEKAGYQIIAPLAIPGYSLLSPEGIKVDMIFGKDPWLKEALAKPARDPAGYPVIKLPYLILLKMAAQRRRAGRMFHGCWGSHQMPIWMRFAQLWRGTLQKTAKIWSP